MSLNCGYIFAETVRVYLVTDEYMVTRLTCTFAHTHTHTHTHQTVGCRPIASIDHFLPEHLGSAGLVEEVAMGTSKVVKVQCYI